MSLRDLDEAAWRSDQRREARQSARGERSPLDTEPQPRLRSVPTSPPFVLADPGRALNGAHIPQVRLDLIEFLREHPGEWVRYDAAGTDDVTPRQIAKLADTATGGFGLGFTATVRDKASRVYVRYTPGSGPTINPERRTQ
jgi:hypothetical protein